MDVEVITLKCVDIIRLLFMSHIPFLDNKTQKDSVVYPLRWLPLVKVFMQIASVEALSMMLTIV